MIDIPWIQQQHQKKNLIIYTSRVITKTPLSLRAGVCNLYFYIIYVSNYENIVKVFQIF